MQLQHEEESEAEYITTLKHLATHCDFGSFLNDALRDHLVVELSQDSIQSKLLAEDKRTFKKSVHFVSQFKKVHKVNWHVR